MRCKYPRESKILSVKEMWEMIIEIREEMEYETNILECKWIKSLYAEGLYGFF